MAEGKKLTVAGDEITLPCGLASIPTADLRELLGQSVNARGIVLANDRIKIHVMHDDKPVEYTLSLYVQRGPLDEAEAESIAATAAERKERKAADENAEQTKRERETRRAFELGQEATFGALKNVVTLAEAGKALSKLA